MIKRTTVKQILFSLFVVICFFTLVFGVVLGLPYIIHLVPFLVVIFIAAIIFCFGWMFYNEKWEKDK